MIFDVVMVRRIQDMATTSGQRIFSKNSDPGTSRQLLSRKEDLGKENCARACIQGCELGPLI